MLFSRKILMGNFIFPIFLVWPILGCARSPKNTLWLIGMTVCPPFPLRIFLFLRAEARAGGREGPRPRPPFSFSIVAAAAQHFRSPPSHCSSRRPHSKRSRLAFKNNKRAFSTMMGMRPGIILLREGTDTSQVRHFTKKMCRRDDDREGAGGGGGGVDFATPSLLLPHRSAIVFVRES